MAELPTYEETKICPKCGQTGEVRSQIAAPKEAGMKPGTTIHFIYCVTKLCRWYNTPWEVQVNPDGSVPAPRNHALRKDQKIYHGFDDHDERANQIIAALKANSELETTGDAELGRNYR